MVNIWDYVDAKIIRITDIDGEKFTGEVVSVFDGGETVDGEDDITIDCGGIYIGFKPSDILRIDRIE